MIRIGLLGKPNSGKSTFFSAATGRDVKIADYPFTTINPNVGIAYASIDCVCKEFGVKDTPRNSVCINGIRFIPVELWDVAGLVPGAWQGRGLGNQFLDDLRQADVLIHVVDASGRYDAEGKDLGRPGIHDPIEDIRFLEQEIQRWFWQILKRNWDKFARKVEVEKKDLASSLATLLSGLNISKEHVEKAIQLLSLNAEKPSTWSDDDLLKFAGVLREVSKPIVIVANKLDVPASEENLKRLQELNIDVVPASALAELILVKLSERGVIKYIRGGSSFEVVNPNQISDRERKLLEKIQEFLDKWGSTGIQKAMNHAVFNVKKMIAVYPVEDENKLTDRKGNILPDVFLVPKGTTALNLAEKIHSDLAKNFIYALDVRTKTKLPADYELKHRDVIKIYAAAKKK
ncbi:MAG: redox-regulated ATPase YchF [Crenarchaeota archaeon]|nr:redox-regulated ATPase YchF [Thermoproteota archaeon]MCR8463153.1 redox-regulated ATPase YchF [Thermoproteota archaeon]MCR8471028.1 redox-regulated ATPase YchF [Thermoproteota archaeon]MCR8471844.1 redox-regulated ATPase YchF [Thermoproteota archaeon]MCR8472820.1 redox-regulated ATPase YchF [Thermoproteota archaeon]